MVLTLAQRLEVPLRERNRLLLAAGYAPHYQERSFDGPELAPVRDAVGRLLAGHEPYPALAVDMVWNLVASNGALDLLLEGVADELLVPPANCMRLALHPDGLAPRILNLGEWRGHLLARLRREASLRRDPRLDELLAEVESYPGEDRPDHSGADIMVTLRLASSAGELTLFSTVTTFGTAADITVAELSIETFFPADPETAEALKSGRRRGRARSTGVGRLTDVTRWVAVANWPAGGEVCPVLMLGHVPVVVERGDDQKPEQVGQEREDRVDLVRGGDVHQALGALNPAPVVVDREQRRDDQPAAHGNRRNRPRRTG